MRLRELIYRNQLIIYLEFVRKKDHIKCERLTDSQPANPVRPGREQP